MTGSGTASPATGSLPPVKRQRGRTGLVIVIVVVIVVAAIGAIGYQQKWFGGSSSGTNEASCVTGVTLQGNGAQIVIPLMSQWTHNYASQTGNQVNYPGAGSGTGLTDFTDKEVDFGITDNPLSPAQRGAITSQPLTIPIVGGAITVIYNLPGLTAPINLTGALLAQIFNGNITTWNNSAIQSINPGVSLPGNVIFTVHRSDSAGTSYVITDLMSQDSPYWNVTVGKGLQPNWPKPPAQTGVKGNSLMLSTVAGTKYSIGYSDLTDTLTYTSAIQYAAIQNPSGKFVVPTIADTTTAINDKVASLSSLPSSTGSWYNVSMVNAHGAGDYPVATFIYMYIYQNGSDAFTPGLNRTQVVVQWADYILSSAAQSLVDSTTIPLYYVPLPSAVLSADNAGLQTMVYNGAALPACK